MKREIKFRSWDGNIRNGVSLGDGSMSMEFGIDNKGEFLNAESDNLFQRADYRRQKGIVIMQYTGTEDKNGKEIYEGDILKTRDDYGNNQLGVVSFNNKNYGGVMGWNLLDLKSNALEYYYGMTPSDSHEIIGNIYENPWLLKIIKIISNNNKNNNNKKHENKKKKWEKQKKYLGN